MKRTISAVLTGALMVSLLAGCNGDGGGGGGAAVPMGRYVEEQGESFENMAWASALRRDQAGNVFFYGQTTDGDQSSYHRYSLTPGAETAEASLVSWLGDFIKAEGSQLKDISEAPDGTVYFLYYDKQFNTRLSRRTSAGTLEPLAVSELEGGGGAGAVVSVGDASVSAGDASVSDEHASVGDSSASNDAGGSVTYHSDDPSLTARPKEPAAPQESEVPQESPGPDVSASEPEDADAGVEGSKSGTFSFGGEQQAKLYASGVLALDDGFLLLFGDAGAYRYDAQGAKRAEYMGTAYGGRGAALYNNTLLLAGSGESGIAAYDLESGKSAGTYSYESKDYLTIAGMDEKGLYLGDSSGIYRQAQGGTIWEKQVDGSMTSLVMPNVSISGLCPDGDTGYYALLSTGETTYQLVHYYYDAETPTNPDTELTIFSLKDNPTVRQAIGEFQRRNPNVRINFRVAMDGEDSAATAEDVIRSLNTEILNGKGPDLLLLDGLPVDSYIDKGVLADLTPLVEKMEGEGLLANLMNAYERDGKIYGVPSRFSVPVIMGAGRDLDGLDSLETLASRLEGDAGAEPPLLWGPEDLWREGGTGMLMKYYNAYAGGLLKDGALDQGALERYLDAALRVDGAVKAYTPELGDEMAFITVTVPVRGGSGYEALDNGSMQLKQGRARIHIQELGGRFSLSNIISNLSDLEGYRLESLFGQGGYTPVGGVGVVASGKQQELAQSFMEMLLSRTVQDNYLYDGFPVHGASLSQMVDEILAEGKGELIMGSTGGKSEELQGSGEYNDMGFLELCRSLHTPILADQVVREAVESQTAALLKGDATPAEAAASVVEKTRLYLAE